jgi:hypothetical protein
MKALSIKQPWAELILQKRKTIELRTWNTKFRGYFLIHASGDVDLKNCKRFNLNCKELPRRAIVGVAKLVDIKVYNNKEEFLRDKNKHLADKFFERLKFPIYGFILEDVKRIKPIKHKGSLGFFNVNLDLKYLRQI